jgi:hypothetical protein
VAPDEGFSGVGRDGLLRAVAQLEAKVASLEDQVRERETWHAPNPYNSDRHTATHAATLAPLPYGAAQCSTCARECIEGLETENKRLGTEHSAMSEASRATHDRCVFLEKRIKELGTLKDELGEALHAKDPTFLRLMKEYDAMLQNLTAAQAAGTEAQLGRQRARALLREVLISGALTTSPPTPRDLEALTDKLYKELGMLGQREQNDRAAKAVKS